MVSLKLVLTVLVLITNSDSFPRELSKVFTYELKQVSLIERTFEASNNSNQSKNQKSNLELRRNLTTSRRYRLHQSKLVVVSLQTFSHSLHKIKVFQLTSVH